MRSSSILAVAFLLWGLSGSAQVISPAEIKDVSCRELQSQYLEDLKLAGKAILGIKTEYPFFLSRKLDMELEAQRTSDQRGIQFNIYNGQTVLAVTGNYYAAYASDKMNSDRRARETYLNIVFPILQAVVPPFQSNKNVQGFAVEVSHHVLGKVMDVDVEHPENLFVFLPKSAALRLLAAKDETAQQAALLQGTFLLNGDAVIIWVNRDGLPTPAAHSAGATQESPKTTTEIASATDGADAAPVPPPVSKARVATPPPPPRDTSPAALSALETVNSQTIASIKKDLTEQAHLVPYAPPAFVVFHEGIYLQLSMNTDLAEPAGGSHYQLAALAFDDHIAHLIRPVMKYFRDGQQFDGIDFSTTVHLSKKGSNAESVEFFLPFSTLRCYEKYDCTGQQLIDDSTVLINGERVSLDLQIAESSVPR